MKSYREGLGGSTKNNIYTVGRKSSKTLEDPAGAVSKNQGETFREQVVVTSSSDGWAGRKLCHIVWKSPLELPIRRLRYGNLIIISVGSGLWSEDRMLGSECSNCRTCFQEGQPWKQILFGKRGKVKGDLKESLESLYKRGGERGSEDGCGNNWWKNLIGVIDRKRQQRVALLWKCEDSALFSSTYTKIGSIQIAWPFHKDDTKIREVFHIF